MPPDSSVQRTRLSWRRTSLVATVVAILLVRLALHEGRGLGAVATAGLCWVGLLVVIQRRVDSLPAPIPPHALILTAGLCAALGVLGVVLVVG